MPRGALIVFEGAEGVGKSTQLRLAAEWLSAQGFEVVAVREPGGTILGDQIRRILLDPASDITTPAEALLFIASRAQLVEREIRPAVMAGATVLVDRFFLSTYAYQGAGRGLPEEDLRSANHMATGGLVPDLTLLITLPVAAGLARAAERAAGGHDRIEASNLEFHERVARAFGEFATPAWQAAHPECGPIVLIDGTGSEAAVFGRVASAVRSQWPGSFPAEVLSRS
jgi:dTMP kinase